MVDPYYYDKLVTLNQVYHNGLIPCEEDLPGKEWIKTTLFPHQTTMVHRMRKYRESMTLGITLEEQALYGKIGIVGDAIGTGKTLSVLAYLASIFLVPSPLATSELTPFSTRYFYSHTSQPITDRSTHLIIVPHALFHEWKEEIQRHTTLKYVAIETRRALRGDTLSKEMSESSFVLTTNKCYRYVNEYAYQNRIQWNQIFLDEASSIYMSSSDPPLRFQFMWLITHEWIPLLFKSSSFHRASLCRMRSHVPSLHPELETWLTETHAYPYEATLTASGFLKDYLTFYHPSRYRMVLRNPLSASTIPLPTPLSITAHCRPNLSLTSLASYAMSRPIQNQHLPSLFQGLGTLFHSLETYLPLHPMTKHALIRRNIADNECVICLERCVYPTMVDCCYHLYCGTCLLRSILMNGKCATCRDHVHPTNMACFAPIERIQTKNKMEVCLEWIRDNPEGRFIIYSAFDNVFYQLFEGMDRMGRKAERVDHHILSQRKTIQRFKEGTTQILFVSHPEWLRGMSFPFVTHLIFYHDQPSYEKKNLLLQSAHRWGRSLPLHVIQLSSEVRVS